MRRRQLPRVPNKREREKEKGRPHTIRTPHTQITIPKLRFARSHDTRRHERRCTCQTRSEPTTCDEAYGGRLRRGRIQAEGNRAPSDGAARPAPLLPPPSHYHEGRFRPASAFGMRARVPQSLDVGVGEPGSAPPRFRSLLLLSTGRTIDHRCARLVPRSALTAMNACACGNPRICGIGHGIESHLLHTTSTRGARSGFAGTAAAGAGATASAGAEASTAPAAAEATPSLPPLELRRWLVGEAPLPFERLVAMGGAADGAAAMSPCACSCVSSPAVAAVASS